MYFVQYRDLNWNIMFILLLLCIHQGNDNLHVITSSNDYLLRFDLEDFDGDTTYAEYSTFRIGNEASRYILSIGGYSGTAGN